MNNQPYKSAYKTQYIKPDPTTAQKAFWLSQLAKDQLYVVICQNQDEVIRLESELLFFGVQAKVFADWEILPYDRLSVSDKITAERIALLCDMPKTGIVLISVQSLMQRLAPPSYFLGQYFDVAVGGVFDRQSQRERLILAGYRLVEQVYSPGEFALRGSVVDIFVVGQSLPFRLELFDDEIVSIRFFDNESQRTIPAKLAQNKNTYTQKNNETIQSIRILPAKEFDFKLGKEHFRQNFAHIFADVSARKVPLYQDVMADITPGGIEFYAPLFFDLQEWQNSSFFGYLPSHAVLVYEDDLQSLHMQYWQEINARFENFRHDSSRPLLPPALLYLQANEFFAQIKPFAQLFLGQKGAPLVEQTRPLPDVGIDHKSTQPLSKLIAFCQNSDARILLVSESAGRRALLLDLLHNQLDIVLVADFVQFRQSTDKIAMAVSPIERYLYTDNLCVISEAQIFGRQIIQTRHKKSTQVADAFLFKSVAELTDGQLVVHMEHGIGRYLGLILMDVGEGEQEFIHLRYADDANIYVPIGNIALIGKYSSADTADVPLSKLGSGRWDKTRQKALEQIYDVAAELLHVQARRNAKSGIAFNIDQTAYELFASGFTYEETADQTAAILAVMDDMKQNKPMDRLICGDVGFGKTEVAMRAAFIAVQAGYQVAVLVPTTLLAKQHEDNFKNRFADWPIRIEGLSRFGAKKQQTQILADLAAGKVDIIIGTHKLLQDDVRFMQLGLLIVDEEHRFGVRHKERIKALQADVDSLSMTATPIPRTLNMALSGMQDISIIATPPARRLAIKTFLVEQNPQTTTDAILRELLRGGQVYYLHNDVASIDAKAQQLSELIVEAKIGIAHGQMAESELAQVMSDFYHKKTNVLVASTIIETGIDVPSANTIIIHRADKFGLAQLHQLRGRVGRSHHQAYCYLFVPSIKGLSADAQKRLEAVVRASDLGAGFMLASEDLEIRGAGEILGKEQSGHMQNIGFGLYMDMLARATCAIKDGKTPKLQTPLDIISDVNLHASALIEHEYLPDVSSRLLFYKRIASAKDDTALLDIRTEMIDRFGNLPQATSNLFLVHKVRILAHALAISRVDVTAQSLTLEFREDTPIDGAVIVRLLQSDDGYRMQGAASIKYVFKTNKNTLAERADAAMQLLTYLHKQNQNLHS